MRARDNPFATHRVLQVRYHFTGDSWDALFARLWSLGNRAAIVGAEGAGKTTLLEDLGDRLASQGYSPRMVRCRESGIEPCMAKMAAGDFVLLDSCERLGPMAWARLRWKSRKAAGLVVTAHRPGRLPTLIHCSTTPDLLDHCIRELLGHHHGLSTEQLHNLFTKHRGNIRNAIRELYDLSASHSLALPARLAHS